MTQTQNTNRVILALSIQYDLAQAAYSRAREAAHNAFDTIEFDHYRDMQAQRSRELNSAFITLELARQEAG